MQSFPCYQCGACCKHVYLVAETQFLDRGDGICRHYNVSTKSCTIYATRPDVCRVDTQYALRYSEKYTWNEFITINIQVCHDLEELDLLKAI